MTPACKFFIIWPLVETAQVVWVLHPFLYPSSRNHKGIEAVGYNFLFVCIGQVGWEISWTNDIVWLGFFWCLWNFFFLLIIIDNLRAAQIKEDYFLWRFPFSTNYALMFVSAGVAFSNVLQAWDVPAVWQAWAAAVTIVCVVAMAVALLAQYDTDLAGPSVLVWAFFGIVDKLSPPPQVIEETFSAKTINMVRNASIFSGALIVAGIYYKASIALKKRRPIMDDMPEKVPPLAAASGETSESSEATPLVSS